MFDDDTSLVRLVIQGLTEKYGWTYDDAMERFYNSAICAKISDERTGLFTCAPIEIIELFEEELD